MKKLWLSTLCFTLCSSPAWAQGESHHSGLPQLNVNTFPSQIFWLFVVFAILYVFFSKKTLPEISKVLENRKERIENDLASAEKLRQEAEDVHNTYEESLSDARQEAAQAFKDFEKSIEEQSEKNLEDIRIKTAESIAALEEKINQSLKNIMADMENIAAEIAADAAEKIIDMKIDKKEALDIVSALDKPVTRKTSKAA